MDINKDKSEEYAVESLDLVELLLLLWKRKIFIISIVIIISLLSGLYGFTQQKTIYQSHMNIKTNVPNKYLTKYGEFTLPITTSDQYINLLKNENVLSDTIDDLGYDNDINQIEEMSSRINITNSGSTNFPNTYAISISADSEQEAEQIKELLYKNYIQYLNATMLDNAITYFEGIITEQNIAIKTNSFKEKIKLESYLELLNETPQFISFEDSNNEYHNSDKSIIVLNNYINPEYDKLSKDIISLKQLILDYENQETLNSQYLDELSIERASLENYYETGEFKDIGTYIDSVINSGIKMSSNNKIDNIENSLSIFYYSMIGVIVGLFFSSFFVVMKEYICIYLKSNKSN